jgi:hypothetical protein
LFWMYFQVQFPHFFWQLLCQGLYPSWSVTGFLIIEILSANLVCVCFLFLLLLPLQDFALCVIVLYFSDIHSAFLKFCTLYLEGGDRVMLWPDWPWTHCEAPAGLELVLLLPQHCLFGRTGVWSQGFTLAK